MDINKDKPQLPKCESIKLDFENNINENVSESDSWIEIKRSTIDSKNLSINYGKREADPSKPILHQIKDQLHGLAHKYSKNCSFLGWFTSLFPIFVWIRSYSIKNYLINDIISGLTISILHIPQGLANGLLAGLAAINGLYVSFFPSLIYAFMGTGFHTSIGTFSVMSIMVSEAASAIIGVEEIGDNIDFSIRNNTGVQPEYTPVEVLTSLCLLCGIVQLLMGFLHLGILSVVFSDTLVSALQTAAAIHVATSQLPMLFNIKTSKMKYRYFKLIWDWINIFSHLNEANPITIGIGITAIIILLVVKEYVEPKLREKYNLKLPIPIDIIVVILATLLSWLFDLGNDNHKVDIVGDIPLGLPIPQLPNIALFPQLLMDAVVISVVAYAITLSLGQTFGKKHNHEIDANQELIALGTANVFSSFFFCFTCCPALSRTSVSDRVGGKTQVTGLVSSAVLLVVLLFLGSIFYNLPKCILAAIIIVALKSMFMMVKDFWKALRVSKLEGLSWFVTFTSVILLDVDLGLLVGIVISLCFILVRLSIPNSLILGRVPNSELYVNIDDYKEAQELKGIKIFHYSCSLFFINRHSFKENLYKKVFKVSKISTKASIFMQNNKSPNKTHTVIIDCSPINYIDSSGVGTIEEVIRELNFFDINVVLASCNEIVFQMLEKTKFHERFTNNVLIYASVHDAVISILCKDHSKLY